MDSMALNQKLTVYPFEGLDFRGNPMYGDPVNFKGKWQKSTVLLQSGVGFSTTLNWAIYTTSTLKDYPDLDPFEVFTNISNIYVRGWQTVPYEDLTNLEQEFFGSPTEYSVIPDLTGSIDLYKVMG